MKRGKDKRSIEFGWEQLFSIIIILILMAFLIFFIARNARDSLAKKEILAKEICMALIATKPGTTIMIQHDKNTAIEKKENGIIVKRGIYDLGYFYKCYLGDNVIFTNKDDKTTINIIKTN